MVKVQAIIDFTYKNYDKIKELESAGEREQGKIFTGDMFGKFIIVDGIDYKSNSDTDKLLYMEV